MSPVHGSRRWLALSVLCLGVVMIVLDSTIVNVALPSIRADLQFTETDLVWVVNAYLLTFGGCLLLGGRLGDLYGALGLAVLASLAAASTANLTDSGADPLSALTIAAAVVGMALPEPEAAREGA